MDQHKKEEGWQTTKRSKTKAKSGEVQRKEGGNQSKEPPEDKANENKSVSNVTKENSSNEEEKELEK